MSIVVQDHPIQPDRFADFAHVVADNINIIGIFPSAMLKNDAVRSRFFGHLITVEKVGVLLDREETEVFLYSVRSIKSFDFSHLDDLPLQTFALSGINGALAASRSDVGINSKKNRSDVSVRTRKDPYVHPKYSR